MINGSWGVITATIDISALALFARGIRIRIIIKFTQQGDNLPMGLFVSEAIVLFPTES